MNNLNQRRPRVRDITYRRAFLRDRLNVWLRLAANPCWKITTQQARRNAARIQRTLTQLG